MKKLKWLFKIFIIGNLLNSFLFVIYHISTERPFLESSRFLMIVCGIEFLMAFLCLTNSSDELSQKRNEALKVFSYNQNAFAKPETHNSQVFLIFSMFGFINILYLIIMNTISQ